VDRAAEHLRCTVRPVRCPSPRAPPGRRADGFTDRSRTCPDLHRSIPEDAWVLAYRGETYQAMERYEEAWPTSPRHRTRLWPRLGHRRPRRDIPGHGRVRGPAWLQPPSNST